MDRADESDKLREARESLSIAVKCAPYIGKWATEEANCLGVDVKEYVKEAKARNKKEQDDARKVLFDANGGGTIWYYKELPSMGNKFRCGNRCWLTGLPWAFARNWSIERRRLISDGLAKPEDFILSRKDRP